ncbi:hypothetical protein EDD16DRAFT_1477906, partial [Pisolithus croceorrhizus]
DMAMLGKTFLARLSRNIAIGKMAEGTPASSDSFGGINVIMSLYIPGNPRKDSTLSQVGRAIYEEFQTVVLLQQQMRVTDEVWRDFLHHLRMGRVQQHHLDMLRTLILTSPGTSRPDFTRSPWALACLVTPRHAVQQQWNHAALHKHAVMADAVIVECVAEDTVRGEPLTLAERYAFAMRGSKTGNQKRVGRQEHQTRRGNHELPDTIELCVGCSVMVTENVETDLDITNGARGTIVDIFLHPNEPPITCINGVVRLKLLPSFVLVKLHRTRTSQLHGLEPCVIPVEPVSRSYRVRCKTSEGVDVTRTIKRWQFPITSAYAFTDYRSQGQTIPYAIVDIAKPPTGALTLFNLYVALACFL